MSPRMSLQEARAQGVLKQARLFRRTKTGQSTRWNRKGDRRPAAREGRDPQAELLQALSQRFPQERIESEAAGLIPGRKYRADIYLPDHRLVIEVDGFAFHSSKTAFQKDRERQNAFVTHGYRVLRYFNRQIRQDLDALLAQVESCINKQEG